MQGSQTILTPPPGAESHSIKKGGKRDNQHGPEGPKAFAFDRSYWSFDKNDPNYADQSALFKDLGVPLLENAFGGYNNCIFAYGQTGSGKSYSMMGYGEEIGIIPLICKDMFKRINELQSQDPNLTCTVEVSYLEIYNEKVRDLLNPATKGNLKVREHPSTGPYVEDLAKLAVRSFQEIENLMDEGNKARTVAATNMNQTSSRSHAVFTLTMSQKRHDKETTMDTEKVSRISLVDLAGSERATSTGATGARLKEGAEINRSLSTLGRVIAALADLSSGKVHKKKAANMVPYRDSVLTWLLKDSLGGNSMTAMIAAISPADINYDETLSTLRYADSAKRIQNHAVVNEDPNARMIRELKEELAQLRSKLGGGAAGGIPGALPASGPGGAVAAPGGGVVVPAEEYYPPDTPMEKQMVSITSPDGTIKKVSKAEIMEQLNQSEKLYTDLNQTWEEKLQKTEKIHKEREQALEELGISIEKGFVGLSTPKKSPHLVNLSDDPLLTECLVYNIKPGLTVVGHVDAHGPLTATPPGSAPENEEEGSENEKTTPASPGPPPSEIRLDGSRILSHHCMFDNVDNVVTIIPSPGAAVMVNGLRINEPKRLRSGFRIILGDFHIFRFNHPMEARAERVEQRLVRQNVGNKELTGSVTVPSAVTGGSGSSGPGIGSPLAKSVMTAGYPGPGGHERTDSLNMTMSMAFDLDPTINGNSPRVGSPTSLRNIVTKDLDWRREAVGAGNGAAAPEKIKELSDTELDALFDDVQKARAVRRSKIGSMTLPSGGSDYGSKAGGSQHRSSTPADGEEDSDSQSQSSSAFPIREKYMSNSTMDNMSLDTAITMPSTSGRKGPVRNSLEGDREDIMGGSRTDESSGQEEDGGARKRRDLKELLAEKIRMAEQLEATQRELQRQRETFEEQMKDLPPEQILSLIYRPLEEKEIVMARNVAMHWRARNYVQMAETVLKKASLLKEAQVMSQIMDKHVVFQFAIIDFGHVGVSAYDLVRGGLPNEDDIALEDARKPCVGVRVIDFANSVIYLWSLEKLARRVHMMRRMHQYIDRPDYIRHFKLENTFGEACAQQYSLIGDADIPLAAVFESTVQDFALEVISPYTQSVVGIVRLSLEPSTAEAPSSTLKFNVVMRDMVGFAEHEGTDVHAQLSIPGIDEHDGATTTSMIRGFDENAVRFESVHGMSLPHDSPRSSMLKLKVYARVTPMHLEKLISWDQIRDAPEGPPQQRRAPRIAESEYYNEERNDVFARIQILELAENGKYLPVEVTMTGPLDAGTYQLHQGLQRRIAIHLTHSAGENLPWADITKLKIGNIRLLDPYGKVPDMDVNSPDVYLKLVKDPLIKDNADGTTNVSIVGQWDSSLHSSQLLDRITQDKYKVELTLSWHLISPKVQEPIIFEMDLRSQVLARSYVRPQSMFKQLWSSTRLVHSVSGIFSIVVRPVSAKRAADLWRMNTLNDYVKGEELLVNWAPRKVSLIRDFFQAQKRRKRIVEIEAARGALGPRISVPYLKGSTAMSRESRDALMRKYLSLWRFEKDPIENILVTDHTEPPENGAAFAPTANANSNSNSSSSAGTPENSNPASSAASESTTPPSLSPWQSKLSSKPRFVAAIQHLPKNPTSTKSGFLFMPDDTYSHWVRRFVDLRVPYLHIHSVPEGDEVNAINLTKSHVDHQPDFARLLDEGDVGGMGRVGMPGMRFKPNVFAIYSPENTFLFATRTEALKIEWILKIDQSYFSTRTPVERPRPVRLGGFFRKGWSSAD